MALRKSVVTLEGFTAEYWRVAPYIHFDALSQTLGAQIMLYVNETARRADKPPVPIPNLEKGMEGIPAPVLTGKEALEALATGDPRVALYKKLKADPFFAGAEDV